METGVPNGDAPAKQSWQRNKRRRTDLKQETVCFFQLNHTSPSVVPVSKRKGASSFDRCLAAPEGSRASGCELLKAGVPLLVSVCGLFTALHSSSLRG